MLATVKDEPLRGGLTAILDRRCARQARGIAGRDDGMAILIEQQDGGLDEAVFPMKGRQESHGSECSFAAASSASFPLPPLRCSASSACIWQL